MEFHYDWNIEVITQFYATLFFEEAGSVRATHCMIEGEWYHITYNDFATRFSFEQADKNRSQIHLHNPLGENEMKFMYAPK
jgi:hypothetical protein